MALETVASVFYFALYASLDFLIYVLVDIVAKNSLRDARDEEEKRMVWLYEAGVLFAFCLPIYLLHHQPYILFLLTTLTFAYTQLQGRVNFRYWWHLLVTRWEEFQQHEESMEHLQEMQTRQAQNPTPVQMPINPPISGPPVAWMPQPPGSFIPVHNVLGPGQQRAFSECNVMPTNVPPAMGTPPAYTSTPMDSRYLNLMPRGSQLVRRSIHPQSGSPPGKIHEPTMMPGNFVPVHNLVHNNPKRILLDCNVPHTNPANSAFNAQAMSPPLYSSSPMDARYMPMIPPGAHLMRRPLNSHPASQNRAPASEATPNLSSKIKTSVMSALGFALPDNPLPGLKNSGQNICFLNSVLQCLAHSPGFVDSLVLDSRMIQDSTAEMAPLIDTLADLLEHLAVVPGGEKHGTFDTHELRRMASSQAGSLIVSPQNGNQNQTQQDAAEFLMWLLDALHTTLNCRRQTMHPNTPGPGMVERHPLCPRFTAMTLNMLKFIYGDLTPARVNELKLSCRKEIESANGLDSESYAEPIQRLSDLEWLTYKEHNNSAIDDLFTGQLVEAQHCIACNRISVGIQTFNVLPVPIVGPRQLNGIVYLEDCFAKFGNIEDLYGLDGLCCETCNNQQVRTSTPVVGGRQDIDSRTQLQQAAAMAASPVLRNGGVGVGIASTRVPSLNIRRPTSTSDSALQSTFGHTTVMSPIPNAGEVVNDSGFQDHQFKTSTPVHGTVAPVRLTDGQRRSLLRQLPECFIVQLMRFSYHQGQPRKLQRPVSVPLVKLDLTHLIIDNVMKREDLTALNACFRYDLYGLCLHLGSESTINGHYISYAQASDGNWYKFDDERVSQINMEYELNTRQVRENAYLLFFRKSVLV